MELESLIVPFPETNERVPYAICTFRFPAHGKYEEKCDMHLPCYLKHQNHLTPLAIWWPLIVFSKILGLTQNSCMIILLSLFGILWPMSLYQVPTAQLQPVDYGIQVTHLSLSFFITQESKTYWQIVTYNPLIDITVYILEPNSDSEFGHISCNIYKWIHQSEKKKMKVHQTKIFKHKPKIYFISKEINA